MQTTAIPDQHIRFLITANYQRMLSYEQAAFLTSELSFKDFYTARADESEANIRQLCLLLNIQQDTDEQYSGEADASFSKLLHGKKTPIKILESIKTIEKTILKWYQSALREISGLPKEIIAMVEQQYHLLTHARLKLELL